MDKCPKDSSTVPFFTALLRAAILPAGFAGALVVPGLLVVVVTWSHLAKMGKGDSMGTHLVTKYSSHFMAQGCHIMSMVSLS